MLKEYLKKVFPAMADNTANAENEEVNMTQATEQATAPADNTAVAEMAAQLASQTEQMTALQTQFAELSTKYAAAEAALAASADAQAKLVEQAAQAKLEDRVAKLSAIMGDVKGPTTAQKLASLDDAAFAVVLESYASSFKAEEKSEMFSEKGVAAEASPTVVEESAEMKKIKAEQAAARLQTN